MSSRFYSCVDNKIACYISDFLKQILIKFHGKNYKNNKKRHRVKKKIHHKKALSWSKTKNQQDLKNFGISKLYTGAAPEVHINSTTSSANL